MLLPGGLPGASTGILMIGPNQVEEGGGGGRLSEGEKSTGDGGRGTGKGGGNE